MKGRIRQTPKKYILKLNWFSFSLRVIVISFVYTRGCVFTRSLRRARILGQTESPTKPTEFALISLFSAFSA